jgi:hypothetical protein
VKSAVLAVITILSSAPLLYAEVLSFEKLCAGDRAVYGIEKKLKGAEIVIARSEGELKRLWAEDVTGSYSDMKGLPDPDWDRTFVVAIFLGRRPTAGYGFYVCNVRWKGKALEVGIEEKEPLPQSTAAQVITSPYALIACQRAGIALEEILVLRLLDRDGKAIVERPAWSYRLMKRPGVEK